MTHDHLATLLREEVRATEPSPHLDPMVPVRLGRRRLRGRRLAAGVAAAFLLGTSAVAVPQLVDRDDAVPVADAASLADLVEPVLDRSLPDLPPPVRHDTAYGVEVFWGDLRQSFSVTVDDTPWLPDRPAADEVVAQRVLGNVTAGDEGYPSYAWADVAPDRLHLLDRGDRFFTRQAELVRDGVRVLVSERVLADNEKTAMRLFAVPVDDLLAIAADPEVAAAR